MNPAAAATHPHTNRLAQAASPYLLQHQHNPVDWYEWSPEALQKARDENKPIFLSIGYAACHWCHVMAHESFENDQTAAVMNRYFVNIKVDREERPDLDDIYMQATMLMNQGQGGWPMSVWLAPDLKPFFTGTYFPPEARWGRTGFREMCERIGEMWAIATDRERLLAQSEEVTRAVRESLSVSSPVSGQADELTEGFIDRVAELLANHFDPVHGGMPSGGTNKFPPSMALDLLLRSASRRSAGDATRATLESVARLTLDKMAAGGIYDHLAGGIARYSTDEEWLVPHFEKMLYDQALVSRIYLDAHQYFQSENYAHVARGIFDYVLADLRSPEGGFYSSRDADSEGEEGRYYVWTRDEIFDLLDSEIAETICAYYGVSESGNWEDPHAPGVPKNILHIASDLDSLASHNGVSRETLQGRIEAGRVKLLEARKRRVPPGLDDKVLAEWNGLMISALARGGAVLDEPKYVQAAAAAADFILTQQTSNGRLNRAWRKERKLEAAFLTDYAAIIEGLLELYEATFERRWLDSALALNERATELFWDAQGGGYFFTSSDHEQLLTRNKDLRDGATPSGNSMQFLNLLRLSVMTGDARLQQMAETMVETFAGEVASAPAAYERFLAGLDFAGSGAVELAVVGGANDATTKALLRTIRSTYLPNRVIMMLDPRQPSAAPASPLLEGRKLVNGKAAVYVCRNYTCQKPVTAPAELATQLSSSR